jgi:hypothetical protein
LEVPGFIGRYRPGEINLIDPANMIKLLVQMLGGTIRLVRNSDKGSTVFFTVSGSLINIDDTSVDGSDPQENGSIDSGDHVGQYDHWIHNFLQNLRYEVWTPNNPLRACAEMLSSSIDFPAEQQQNLTLLRAASERINQIFSNCLEPFLLPRR